MTVHLPPQWSQPLQQYVSATYGQPLDIQPMPGLSAASVWRVSFPQTRVVIKRAASEREFLFYQTAADELRGRGVPIPGLLWISETAEAPWLVLEHIADPLPASRWNADPDLLHALRCLHQAPLHNSFPPAKAFRPQWTTAMTDHVRGLYAGEPSEQVISCLDELQATSQYLFEPQCWISGDPNPTNWGVRADGSLVLYDWERFGLGSPALDLAISVPGFGSRARFERVARQYAERIGEPTTATATDVQALARDIARAKVWNLVEFMAGASARSTALAILEWARAGFPRWLQSTLDDLQVVRS